MGVISMKSLLEAGVHFGHQTRRWNPKMAKYIYTSRNGIHIIDLQKTSDAIDVAYKALFEIVASNGKVLFVGTKKQSQEPVRDEAIRSNSYYVDKRWLGGTLTNFKTIKRSIKKLQDLYKMEKDGTFAVLPKKEVATLHKEMERLEKFLGGIKEMKTLPQALFIIDPRKEKNAILEARKLGIPVFGIVDTNCDPDDVDIIIPANDDALRSVKLIVTTMANAVVEANAKVQGDAEAALEAADEVEVEVIQEEKPAPRPAKRVEIKTEPVVVTVVSEPKKAEVKPAPAKVVAPVAATVTVVSEPKKAEVKPAPAKVVTPAVAPAKVVAPVVETVVSEPKKVEVKPAPAKAAGPAYDTMTVDQLRQLAKEQGVTGYSSLKKAELIEAIKKV